MYKTMLFVVNQQVSQTKIQIFNLLPSGVISEMKHITTNLTAVFASVDVQQSRLQYALKNKYI